MPKSKKTQETPVQDPKYQGIELCDVRRHKCWLALTEQVTTMEKKKTSMGMSPKDENTLTQFKIEQKKLLFLSMQNKLRAQVLDYTCPPAVRMAAGSAINPMSRFVDPSLDIPPVRTHPFQDEQRTRVLPWFC